MALIELLFGRHQRARVGLVQFDAMLSEVHSKTVEVTEHPVESGTNISDHIRLRPEMLELNGVVTNHPIFLLASLRAPSPLVHMLRSTDTLTGKNSLVLIPENTIQDRVRVAYDELARIMEEGELVTVVTTLRSYENMALIDMQIRRDSTSGNVMNVQLSLREIVVAELDTIFLPQPVTPSNTPARNIGRQEAVPATDAVAGKAAQSVLLQTAIGLGAVAP